VKLVSKPQANAGVQTHPKSRTWISSLQVSAAQNRGRVDAEYQDCVEELGHLCCELAIKRTGRASEVLYHFRARASCIDVGERHSVVRNRG
jgi:hypothetical protein